MTQTLRILSLILTLSFIVTPIQARCETPQSLEESDGSEYDDLFGTQVTVDSGNSSGNLGFRLLPTNRVTTTDNETLTGDSIMANKVVIPKGTVVVSEDDLPNKSEITEIVIPEGVEKIGERAFDGCWSLKDVVLPDSLKEIGDSAFEGCSELKLIKIPRNVEKIGMDAFGLECKASFEVDPKNANFSSVAGVLFDKNQTTLLRFPASSSNLTYAVPNTVKVVADGAFNGCRALTRVVLSPGVKRIGERAFFTCESLASVSIPEGVERIGSEAFWGCSELTSVVLPSSIKRVEDRTFFACSSLKSVVIPASVQSIGSGAFWACSSLTSVDIPQGVTSLEEGVFAYCSSLRSVVIPEGVRSIGDGAFAFCSSLATVAIPQSVSAISDWAFQECRVRLRVPLGSYAQRWAYANKVAYEIAPQNAYRTPARQRSNRQYNYYYY